MLTTEDFDAITKVVYGRSGIVLSPDKAYLIESRLTPIVRARGHVSITQLAQKVRQGGNESLLEEITQAMTTNETFFFRDIKPFDQFEKVVLPSMIASRPDKRLRIWSAACSTGQEPYSVAMILSENAAKLPGWRIDIVGTDLSRDALDRARAGVYSQFEVQRGLPVQLLVKYFKQDGQSWNIDRSIKAMVDFREHNLLSRFELFGTFDVLFCRNVLIYFDEKTKRDILERLRGRLADDGFLYLGGSESVIGITDVFAPVEGQRGLYRPKY